MDKEQIDTFRSKILGYILCSNSVLVDLSKELYWYDFFLKKNCNDITLRQLTFFKYLVTPKDSL